MTLEFSSDELGRLCDAVAYAIDSCGRNLKTSEWKILEKKLLDALAKAEGKQ